MTVASICKACADRGKTWRGTDPKCGFQNGPFDGLENWNCATANLIRHLAEQRGIADIKLHHQENQSYATLDLYGVDVMPEEDDKGMMNLQPLCLWVTWYKSRGRTEGLWLMFDNQPPRPPTEEECVRIIEHYAQASK